jgi:hypothetical protein
MGWATFWAIFSQTHLVTLSCYQNSRTASKLFYVRLCIYLLFSANLWRSSFATAAFWRWKS